MKLSNVLRGGSVVLTALVLSTACGGGGQSTPEGAATTVLNQLGSNNPKDACENLASSEHPLKEEKDFKEACDLVFAVRFGTIESQKKTELSKAKVDRKNMSVQGTSARISFGDQPGLPSVGGDGFDLKQFGGRWYVLA